MSREKINPLQARILNRFYTSKFQAYEHSFPMSIIKPKSLFQTRWGEQDLIENLGIKGEKDRNYFTEGFYDLVDRGYLKEDKGGFGNFRGYFMTGKGLRIIKDLRKGSKGKLEAYSTGKIRDEEKEEGLEKIVASILLFFGALLILQKAIITGAIVDANPYLDRRVFLGILSLVLGLFLIRKHQQNL